jgi:isopentenyl-diphosphate delta-isomerase
VKEVKKAVEMIEADAVAVHLNALHEAVQPEGQTDFKGILAKIGAVAGTLDMPVIVKETGGGIGAEDARKLEAAGVKAIDVGGVGGTSFAAVEYYRSEVTSMEHLLGGVFWDWGIPTAVSLVETAQTVKIPVFASGGVRSGVDVAKALALNACLASVSLPVLQTAVKGTKETENLLSFFIEELKNVMFLVGAENVLQLAKTPVVVAGRTAEWLKTRGFSVEGYAKRGAR